jgi:hypothetical protein
VIGVKDFWLSATIIIPYRCLIANVTGRRFRDDVYHLLYPATVTDSPD